MLDYLDTDRCRMRFLRDQLDDPEADRLRPLRQLRRARPCRPSVSEAARRGGRGPAGPARRRRRAAQDVAHRRWPTSASTSRARSPTAPSEGRAVARLTDLGYGQALRELFRAGTAGRPGPGAAGRAPWSRCSATGARAVDAIVVVESATRPTLVADLADGLSRYLRCPVVGRFAIVDPRRSRRARAPVNSAQRVAAVGRRSTSQADDPAPSTALGAAGRRPGRHRLDAHAGRPRASAGPAPTEVAAAGAGHPGLR